jgi:hypothetical protein
MEIAGESDTNITVVLAVEVCPPPLHVRVYV